MADVEMTEATTTKMYTNPAGRIQRRTSLSDYTFNVNEIEKCLTKDGSQLTKKQKHILTDLRKLDRDGDGDISLIEILALEEDAERAQKSVGRLKKIVCGIVVGIIFCLGCIMCMGIAAIEITKESRVRGGTPVATSGNSATVPASPSSRRRRLGKRVLINPDAEYGKPWDQPEAMGMPPLPSEPISTADKSLEAKYIATQGKTAKEKQALHKEEKMQHCDKCKEVIEAEQAAGAAAPFESLIDPDCLKCSICLFNDGVTTQIVPTHDCPTMVDPTGGEKKVIDTSTVKFGVGSPEAPISITQGDIEWLAKEMKTADETMTEGGANWAAAETLAGLIPTIVKGVPRSFAVDGSSSAEHFEGIKEIEISCPGNDNIEDMVLEGVMMPEETTPGYGNMADFVVAGKGPADAEGHVHIGADGTIGISKSLQEAAVAAGLLGDATNLNDDRDEGNMMIPHDNACYVKAKGTSSPVNMKSVDFAMDTSPDVSMDKFDPVKMELTFAEYPAVYEPPPPSAAYNYDYTEMKQCDHSDAANPCTINDEGVQSYVMGTFVDDDGTEHDIHHLFREEHGTVTHDMNHDMIETEESFTTDDTTGVSMCHGETTMVTHTPEGMDDTMMKETHTYCHGMYCQDMANSIAPEVVVNFDGSMTCGDHECITAPVEYEAASTISPGGGADAMMMGPMTGNFMEMHEQAVEENVRRLKEKHRRLRTKKSKTHKKNVKANYHPLLAAHAYRRLVASVAAADLTIYTSPTNGVMVEDCNAAHQYEIDEEDFNTVIEHAHPTRRLRTRKRRLSAKRHALSKHAFHRRMVRTVRKAHLRARRLAKVHHKTRRRLMAFTAGSEYNYDTTMMYDIDTAAPMFELGPHGDHALDIAHELENEEWMGTNFSAIVDGGIGSPEYYAEEAYARPGDHFVAPVEYAATQASADCGDKKCDQTHTYKEMKVAMDHFDEAVQHFEDQKNICKDLQEKLRDKDGAERYQYYQQLVDPCNEDMAEAEVEVHYANHSQHSAALSFRAEQNMFTAEDYLVDHMYEYVETADTAMEHAMNETMACLLDGTQACTPETFDYEHYWETGETWDHEVDNPMSAYPDFEAQNEARVADHHVDEAVDALIGIGAAMDSMEQEISACTYITFPPEPATDGGMHFSRMHELQFHLATDKPYRRLKQHDYGRRLRKLRQRRGVNEMGGRGVTQERTRARVNERVDRMANEGGRSAVTETFREREEDMRREPRERSRRNPPIEDPRGAVRNTRSERSTRSEATERSRGTRETVETVMDERRPVIEKCSETIASGDRTCNGCPGNRFNTERPDPTCDRLCQKYRECEREVDTTAREMVRASTERSVSLTSGGRRGQVQIQLRERGGRDESTDDRREDSRREDNRRDPGIPERDERAYDNARETIRRRMGEREVRDEREDTRRRERVTRDMRGRIDDERERDSGRRPEPRDTRVDTRVTRDQRRRSNTSFEDTGDSARRIQSPRVYRSRDGSGREVGHLDEPMIDVPERFKCRGRRAMPNCSSVVTFEPSDTSPVRVTFEHNVNGPEELVREKREEEKTKAKEARAATRKASEETRKRERKEKRLADQAARKASAKADRKAKRKAAEQSRKAGKRRKLLAEDDVVYDEPNVTTCSNQVKERMCFDDFKLDEQTGLPSVVFGDKEKGEFRIFFEIPSDPTHDKSSQMKQKICLSIDYCGVVSLDPVTISGQATFPTKVANRIANDCLQATGDAMKCCPGTGKMTRDVARSNGVAEFFVCDTSSMNTDSLVSPTYPVDLTIRHETDISAPAIELSDMGHSPIYITDGIKVDFHFFQEFFPTYAAESEFCAGFDVSSDIPGFTPSCPECSMCTSDGTDKKCMEHSSSDACETDPGCLYNNMTQQCHSLPGNDNLPKVESNHSVGCDDGTAYCGATRSGHAACVPVIDGECFNCKDASVFDHPERVRICKTPSGPTCFANGQMYCAESRKCVDHCGSDCHPRGNSTGIPGIDLTHSPMLIGDPKSHVCAIPNPNVCQRLGKVFCELNQNCVDECEDWACQKDMGASDIYTTHYTELTEVRADLGVKFHSESNYVFYGNASTCRPVTKQSCKAQSKFLCKTQWGTECRDECAWCDGKPAENTDGECVRPLNLIAGNFYCPTTRETRENCTACIDTSSPGMPPLDQESSGNNTCYSDPNAQKAGFYRCSIHTGRITVEYDVEFCAQECTAWDEDTNNFYAKKKHVNNGPGSSGPERTCEVADKDTCTRAGMVWCDNEQTAKEDGEFTGDCVLDCHNCYKPVRIDNTTDMRTPANVQYLPLPVNDSGKCIAQTDMRENCRNKGHYWCEGNQMCSVDCTDCTDTVKEWKWNSNSYSMEEVDTVMNFQVPNPDTGVCDVACPQATANVEYKYDWGGYGPYEQQQPEAYCPLTKTCLRPNNFPYNTHEDPVIAGENTEWDEDKSCSEHCGTYSMVKWDWAGQSTKTCIEATKENCAAEWKVWCPTTRQCLSWSDSCRDDCPGMPFRPPHGPDHNKYDATSCMATKADVADICKNPMEYGFASSNTPQVYCDTNGWARCEDNCDSCTQWKDGNPVASHDDGHGVCNFKSIVTTHSEPVDEHIQEYNHTTVVEDDGTTYETWVEVNYTSNYTEETGEFIEVLDPWCDETQSHVTHCDECGMTYSDMGEFEYSKMVTDESGANCIWPDKVYGCTDLNASNYDPHATHLEEGENCPAGDMDWCTSCEYSSYNNTAGFTPEALPEGQLDYFGMPMNLSMPEPTMYNYSWP